MDHGCTPFLAMNLEPARPQAAHHHNHSGRYPVTAKDSPETDMATANARLQDSLEATQTRLEQTTRPLARKTFLCMAKCYENKKDPIAQVEHCSSLCSQPLMELQQVMNSELQYIGGRVDRCAKACEDEVQDTHRRSGATGQPDPKQQAVLEKAFDTCLNKCADKVLPMLKVVEDKLNAEVSKRL